jgi:hypothetical protein
MRTPLPVTPAIRAVVSIRIIAGNIMLLFDIRSILIKRASDPQIVNPTTHHDDILQDHSLRNLAIAVVVLTGLRLGLLGGSTLGFYGDEAQYWTWAQDLNWDYFTKPPMIAWVIAATTSVCGDGEWCARDGSPLIHAATSFALYAAGTAMADRRTGFWAGLLYLTLPAVSFSSAVISTDVPLLMFFAVALLAFIRLLLAPSWGWALVLGAALGLGLLSKYAMGYFVACAALYLIFTPDARRVLRPAQIAFSVLVAGVIFAPNVLWNLRSDWATFGHLGDNASLDGELFRPGELVDFIGEQLGVFGRC